MDCKITAESVMSHNIGFIDTFKYISFLITKKTFDNSTGEMEAFFNSYDSSFLKKLHALDVSALKELKGDLQTNFEAHMKSVMTKKNKVKSLIGIMTNDVEYYNNELNKLESILSDVSVNNKIKLIYIKLKSNSRLLKDEEQFLAFHKDLTNYTYYLKHFKLGNHKVVLAKQHQQQKNINQYEKIINEELEKAKSELKYNKSEIVDIFEHFHNNTIIKYIEELNLSFEKNMDESELYLNGKLIKNLMDFMNIKYTEARKITEDKQFKQKMFYNVDVEQLKISYDNLNKESIELIKVENFINNHKRTIYVCPVCNFSNTMAVTTNLHLSLAHPTAAKQTKPISMYGIVSENSGYSTLNIPEKYSTPDELIYNFKKNYVQNKNIELINKVVIEESDRIQNNEKMFQRVKRVFEDNKMDNIKANATVDTYVADFKKKYNWLIKEKVFTSAEFNKIIASFKKQIKQVAKTQKINLKKVYDEFKAEIIINIMNQYSTTQDLFDSTNLVLDFTSTLTNNNQNKIINMGNIIQNVIHYDNVSTFEQLPKVFNDIVALFGELKKINGGNVLKSLKEKILYKTIDFNMENPNIKNVDYKISKEYLNIPNFMTLLSLASGNEQVGLALEEFATELGNKGFEISTTKNLYKMWSWVGPVQKEKLHSYLYNLDKNDKKIEKIIETLVVETEDGQSMIKELNDFQIKLKSTNVSKMSKLSKQTIAIVNFIFQLYTNDIISHDITRIKSVKSYDNKKREYFNNMVMIIVNNAFKTLYDGNKKLSNIIYDIYNIYSVVLPKQASFLKTVVVEPKKQQVEEEKTETDKDDLLNDFFDDEEDIEDLEIDMVEEQDIPIETYEDEIDEEQDEVDYGDESDELMEELFGTD